MTALWHPASVGDRRRQHVTLYHEDRIEKIGEDAAASKPAMLAPRTTARAERIHTTHIDADEIHRPRENYGRSRHRAEAIWCTASATASGCLPPVRGVVGFPGRPEKRGECSRGVRVLLTAGVCNKKAVKQL